MLYYERLSRCLRCFTRILKLQETKGNFRKSTKNSFFFKSSNDILHFIHAILLVSEHSPYRGPSGVVFCQLTTDLLKNHRGRYTLKKLFTTLHPDQPMAKTYYAQLFQIILVIQLINFPLNSPLSSPPKCSVNCPLYSPLNSPPNSTLNSPFNSALNSPLNSTLYS